VSWWLLKDEERGAILPTHSQDNYLGGNPLDQASKAFFLSATISCASLFVELPQQKWLYQNLSKSIDPFCEAAFPILAGFLPRKDPI